MTVEERINTVLAHLMRQAQDADVEYPYDALFVETDLPLDELAQVTTAINTSDAFDSDLLPSVHFQFGEALVDIEVCPFGSLVLLSIDKHTDLNQVKKILEVHDITVVSPEFFNLQPHWHGSPLINWLFPQRFSDVLALFDSLRLNL